MNEALILYAFVVMTNLSRLYGVCMVMLLIYVIICSVIKLDYGRGETYKDYMNNLGVGYPIIVFVLIGGFLSVLTPTKSDLKFIVGGTVVANMLQNEKVQELPTNILRATNSFLEKLNEGNKK